MTIEAKTDEEALMKVEEFIKASGKTNENGWSDTPLKLIKVIKEW